MKRDINELMRELNAYLEENKLYVEVSATYDGRMEAEITWGDWKHEHLRFKWLVEEFLAKKGIELVHIVTEVTEEDDSDCYSAIHTLRIA